MDALMIGFTATELKQIESSYQNSMLDSSLCALYLHVWSRILVVPGKICPLPKAEVL